MHRADKPGQAPGIPGSELRAGNADLLAPYRRLKETSPARAGRFIAEGRWLVQRLLSSKLTVESVVVERRRREDVAPYVTPRTTVIELPDGAAEELVGFNFHRGVLACGIRPERQSVDGLVADLSQSRKPTMTVVAVAGVQDPENLGGVIRNAAAFAADAVVLGPGVADPYSRRVLRVSMGHVFQTRLAWSDDLVRDLAKFAGQAQLTTIATVVDEAATPLVALRSPRRSLLLLGEEGYGLPDALRQACMLQVTIPMAQRVDSLNVATTSGILLYHLTQLRSLGDIP